MRPSKQLCQAAANVLKAQALAETLKPVAHKIQSDLLAKMNIRCAHGYSDRVSEGGVLTPSHSYLMSDDDAKLYYPALDAAYRAAGWPDIEQGHCPYLEAESLLRDARRELIEASASLSPLNADIAKRCREGHIKMEHRDEIISSILSYVTQFIPRRMLAV